jgi:hypothetical protein
MAESSRTIPHTIRRFIGPIVLVLLVLEIMHVSLFSGGTYVPTKPNTDLHMQFLGWRFFGFNECMHGHFPFWNPHVFCGIPFFAQFQSNLLYPICWIYFFLSTANAVNIEIAANLSAAAICTYVWARQRNISRNGATLSGAVFVFSGPVYLRVMAGHLAPLATIAWLPLGFLAVDRVLEERFLSGILIGAVAICLQWLGGAPQYVYYGGIVAGLYVLLQSFGRPRILKIFLAFAAIYILGGMLAAVQIIPAYHAAELSVRAGGTSYKFSASLSLAPENLLTFFIPYPFGDSKHVGYVGRWYLWEMSAYIGIINLVLASIGLAKMQSATRWRMIVLLASVIILTLGSYTPVHWWLYKYLPGFGMFRGASKFAALLTLFLGVLAGEGFDRIREGFSRRPAIVAAILGGLCLITGLFFWHFDSSDGPAARLVAMIIRSDQYYNAKIFLYPNLTEILSQWIAWQWFIAGGLMLAVCVLLSLRRWSVRTAYVLLGLAILEVFGSAVISSRISPVRKAFPAQWIQPIELATKADQRVLFSDSDTYSNLANQVGYNAIWGYDPGQPKLYTELIQWSQEQTAIAPDRYVFSLMRISRIFPLLRCAYIFRDDPQQPPIKLRDPMPHVQLMSNYLILDDSRAIDAKLKGDFDFHTQMILESNPTPAPTAAGATGHVQLINQSINDLEIEADLPAPALLLITDAYAPGWHVNPIEKNPNQTTYDVMRADGVLRAIPLSSGHHHFDLSYTPPGVWAGIGVSAVGFATLAAGFVRLTLKRS